MANLIDWQQVMLEMLSLNSDQNAVIATGNSTSNLTNYLVDSTQEFITKETLKNFIVMNKTENTLTYVNSKVISEIQISLEDDIFTDYPEQYAVLNYNLSYQKINDIITQSQATVLSYVGLDYDDLSDNGKILIEKLVLYSAVCSVSRVLYTKYPEIVESFKTHYCDVVNDEIEKIKNGEITITNPVTSSVQGYTDEVTGGHIVKLNVTDYTQQETWGNILDSDICGGTSGCIL